MLSSNLNKVDTEVQTSIEFLRGEDRHVIEEELRKLREDKSLLEGKVRGYLTLSDICHEYKEDLKKLHVEYNKLLEKVNSSSFSEGIKMQFQQQPGQPCSSESPAPDNNDLCPPQTTETAQRTVPNDIRKTTTSSNTTTELTGLKEQLARTVVTRELFDPGVTSPGEQTETKKHDMGSGFRSGDKFPMQESMVGDLDHQSAADTHSLTGMGFEVPSDDLVFEQSASVSRQKSGKDLMMFQSFSITSMKSEKAPHSLEHKIKSITDDNREAIEIKKYIDKISTTNTQLQNANRVLVDKNCDLKAQLKNLQVDNQRLLCKVAKLEQEMYELSMTKSKSSENTAEHGWVHVEKTQSQHQQGSDPTPEFQALQDRCKQLQEANQRWSAEWENLQKHYNSRITDLQAERDRLAKEITELKIGDEAKQRDYEKMLMTSKRRASDEESAKEEANLQLVSANNKIESLQAKIAEQTDTISTLRRDTQSVKMELSVARQQQQLNQSSNDQRVVSQQNQAEIDVLRQQLLVFQEDFEKERQDRAVAQSIKDDFKKQNEALKKRVRHLDHTIANLERQTKAAEDTCRKAVEDKQRLEQELTGTKNQLQRERERSQMMYNYRPQQPPIVQSAGLQPPAAPQQTVYRPRPQQYITPSQPPPQQQYGGRGYGSQYIGGSPQRGSAGTPYYPPTHPNMQTEQLPGAWSCNQCTYVNYPGRTVCEMCGYINSPTQGVFNNKRTNGYSTENLQPRGDEMDMQPPPPQQHQQQQQYMYNTRAPAQNGLPDARNGVA